VADDRRCAATRVRASIWRGAGLYSTGRGIAGPILVLAGWVAFGSALVIALAAAS